MKKDTSLNNTHVITDEEVSSFLQHLTSTLISSGGQKNMLKDRVLHICRIAELVTSLDIKNRTKRFMWLEKVIDLNIKAMTLLELTEPKGKESILEPLSVLVDVKSAIIIKDIARRIAQTPIHYPVERDSKAPHNKHV
ncbi:hypothetical protein KW428_21345 [Vibrio fluvialis]|nr:hypothetical protein [Vibrio fluvialis]